MLVQTIIKNYHKAYDGLLLRLNNITTFHVDLDVIADGWQIVFLSQKLRSILNAKVFGQKIVMVMANQLRLNNFEYKR